MNLAWPVTEILRQGQAQPEDHVCVRGWSSELLGLSVPWIPGSLVLSTREQCSASIPDCVSSAMRTDGPFWWRSTALLRPCLVSVLPQLATAENTCSVPVSSPSSNCPAGCSVCIPKPQALAQRARRTPRRGTKQYTAQRLDSDPRVVPGSDTPLSRPTSACPLSPRPALWWDWTSGPVQ